MNDTSTANANDFSKHELAVIDDVLQKRYGHPVEMHRADIEFGDAKAAEVPAVYWEHNGCHFIIARSEDNKFFSQFFYDDDDQYGTEKPFYEDIYECVMTLLQVQADHELKSAGF